MPVAWDDDHAGWQILDLAADDPHGSATGRQWARSRLTQLGAPHLLDIMLVIGELLNNAHQHADRPVQLRLHRRRNPCEITVAVVDIGGGALKPRAPDDEGGRGLLIVDQVCLAWGVNHHDNGKVVWARLGCTEAGRECPPVPSTSRAS